MSQEVLDEMIRPYPALGCCENEIMEAAIAIIDCFEKKRPLPEDFKERLQLTSPEWGDYLAENLQNH